MSCLVSTHLVRSVWPSIYMYSETMSVAKLAALYMPWWLRPSWIVGCLSTDGQLGTHHQSVHDKRWGGHQRTHAARMQTRATADVATGNRAFTQVHVTSFCGLSCRDSFPAPTKFGATCEHATFALWSSLLVDQNKFIWIYRQSEKTICFFKELSIRTVS